MPQHVRTGTRHLDTCFVDIVTGAADNRGVANGNDRSTRAQEDLAICRGGSPVLDVIDDRGSHHSRERVGRGVTRFALVDLKPLVAPVDVIQFERGDLGGPQSVGGEQQQYGVVALPRG